MAQVAKILSQNGSGGDRTNGGLHAGNQARLHNIFAYTIEPDMHDAKRLPGLIATAALAIAFLCPIRLACQQATPKDLYEKAGQALDAGDTAQAIKLYEELLKNAPDFVDARINLGAALAAQRRYDEAMQQYRRVLALDPKNETALLNLGLALYKEGDFARAHDEFYELHRLRPDNQQALYLLADCDLRLGKLKDAIALAEPEYEAHPDDAALEYILGTAYIRDGQTQKGAAVIDRVMRNGNSAVANLLVGSAQDAAGNYKAAAETLKKALDQNPDIPGAWTIYGQALLNSGENEKGKEALRRALEADPNDFDACLHLGAVLLHDGDTAGAEPYLQHALKLRPDVPAAQFQMYALDAATGHLAEARSGFEKLVRQYPDFVQAHLQLAMVYARLHQNEQSERERRIVVDLNDKARAKGPQPESVP